jgi:tetratricopeptide (TPR) repeat protein
MSPLKTAVMFFLLMFLSGCASLQVVTTKEDKTRAAELLIKSIYENTVEKKTELRKEIIKIAPGSAEADVSEAYINYFDDCTRVGNNEAARRAIKLYSRAISKDPKLWLAYHNRGDEYLSLKQYRSAIENYRGALKIYPSHMPAYANIIQAYISMDAMKEAYDTCMEAMKIDPRYADNFKYLGEIYEVAGQYDKALENYHAALKLYKYDSFNDIYGHFISICMRMNKYDDAIKILNDLKTSDSRANQ